ncbi:MAG: lytic transglycosylase domain-containing protein [Bacteriovoracia bacterium]
MNQRLLGSKLPWVVGFQLVAMSLANSTPSPRREAIHWGYAPAPNRQWTYLEKPTVPFDRVPLALEAALPRMNARTRLHLARHLEKLCVRYSVDPGVILALIHIESSFRTDAVSSKGAIGLMQLMPKTALFIAARKGIDLGSEAEVREKLRDPFINLSLGVGYLAYLRGRYKGKSSSVFAAYLMGPGKFDRLSKQKPAPKFRRARHIPQKKLEPTPARVYIDAVVERITRLK